MEAGIPEPLFAVPRVTAATDEDGGLVIRSAEPLGGYPVTVMHSARAWAAADPGHPMVAERAPGGWRTCGYGEAAAAADAIGQGLLDRGLNGSLTSPTSRRPSTSTSRPGTPSWCRPWKPTPRSPPASSPGYG
jgi:hypothetical protein